MHRSFYLTLLLWALDKEPQNGKAKQVSQDVDLLKNIMASLSPINFMSIKGGAYFWTHVSVIVLPCSTLHSLQIQCARKIRKTLELLQRCIVGGHVIVYLIPRKVMDHHCHPIQVSRVVIFLVIWLLDFQKVAPTPMHVGQKSICEHKTQKLFSLLLTLYLIGLGMFLCAFGGNEIKNDLKNHYL